MGITQDTKFGHPRTRVAEPLCISRLSNPASLWLTSYMYPTACWCLLLPCNPSIRPVPPHTKPINRERGLASATIPPQHHPMPGQDLGRRVWTHRAGWQRELLARCPPPSSLTRIHSTCYARPIAFHATPPILRSITVAYKSD
ncbi:unnamed protein product [Rhizoctonia solani]|nr:unnamed protein product [Rhizoctonia solani]